MNTLIASKLDGIRELCREYKVHRLELFGSALQEERFATVESDVDFLVEFLPLEPGGHADTYFGLLEGLENLLGRRVDLVMVKAVRNPYFLESVQRNKEVLYAA